MDVQTISQIVGSIGLPGAILIYLIWRLDKFLTFLCGKLQTYNKEFGSIFSALEDIVLELKKLNRRVKVKRKK